MKTKLTLLLSLVLVLSFCLLCGCTQPTTPRDGNYTADAVLSGSEDDSVSVQSPAAVTVEDGQLYAQVLFTGAQYDSITVDGVDYAPEADGSFIIPIERFDVEIPFTADGIEYTVMFDFGTFQDAE